MKTTTYCKRFDNPVIIISALRIGSVLFVDWLEQLYPTQMAYWDKDYVSILTRAAHWMAYFDLSKLNLA